MIQDRDLPKVAAMMEGARQAAGGAALAAQMKAVDSCTGASTRFLATLQDVTTLSAQDFFVL